MWSSPSTIYVITAVKWYNGIHMGIKETDITWTARITPLGTRAAIA